MQSIQGTSLAQLVGSGALTIAQPTTLLAGQQLQHFEALCRQTLSYYPNQEFAAETVDNYLLELERLAVKHGLPRLERAFIELRGKSGQKFFPHPTEVAEVIEAWIEMEREARENELRVERTKRERQADIDAFWNEILPDRVQRFGWTEEEALRRFPRFEGTKPSSQSATTKPNVVSMPARDRKAAAS